MAIRVVLQIPVSSCDVYIEIHVRYKLNYIMLAANHGSKAELAYAKCITCIGYILADSFCAIWMWGDYK